MSYQATQPNYFIYVNDAFIWPRINKPDPTDVKNRGISRLCGYNNEGTYSKLCRRDEIVLLILHFYGNSLRANTVLGRNQTRDPDCRSCVISKACQCIVWFSDIISIICKVWQNALSLDSWDRMNKLRPEESLSMSLVINSLALEIEKNMHICKEQSNMFCLFCCCCCCVNSNTSWFFPSVSLWHCSLWWSSITTTS